MARSANRGVDEFKEPDRDVRGEWRPNRAQNRDCPLFFRPFSMRRMIGWLGIYLWPDTVLLSGLAIVTWLWFTPALSTMGQLRIGWMLLILLRNEALIFLVFGGYHLTLYTWKLQGTERKYHPAWQEKHRRFLFHDQVWDNVFRSCMGGVVWTAFEVLYFFSLTHGWLPPILSFARHPVWFVVGLFLIPIWRDVHFYLTHRLLHCKVLMRKVHLVHHYNYNPGPWAGLSMHWIELVLYFTTVLPSFILPLHPVHFLANIQHAGLTPATGHDGFEPPVLHGVGNRGSYFHYLHHRYPNCNFGSNIIPLDRWFGSYYDGSVPYVNRRKSDGRKLAAKR